MKHSYHLKTDDGLSLYNVAWTVPDPKATVIFVHGYLEHIERYNPEAEAFNQSGFSVFGYDHRSHGRSDGKDGYIKDFNDLCRDLKSVIKYIDPATPLYIYAHSVGALVTIKYLLDHQTDDVPQVEGLVTTAAALKVAEDLSPFLQKISGVLAKLIPNVKTVKLPLKTISKVPEVQADYENDPYNYRGGIYANAGHQVLQTTKTVSERFAEIDLPILVMHGGDDQLIEIAGSQRLYDEVSSVDKTFKAWDGLAHEITRSVDKAAILKTMTDWISNRIER